MLWSGRCIACVGRAVCIYFFSAYVCWMPGDASCLSLMGNGRHKSVQGWLLMEELHQHKMIGLQCTS